LGEKIGHTLNIYICTVVVRYQYHPRMDMVGTVRPIYIELSCISLNIDDINS